MQLDLLLFQNSTCWISIHLRMQEYRLSFFITGVFGCIFSLLMLFPACVEYFMEDQLNFDVFINSSMIGLFLSALVMCTSYTESAAISHRASFLATTLVWIQIVFIGAIPLYFAYYPGYKISFADAVFESTSGITTTGMTVLSNLDGTSRGILLWRAMLHFFGGVGIIALLFIVMPYLQSGAMQLFTTESSESQDKETPRMLDMATLIFMIYIVCTVLCTCLYYIFGMHWFDAICHAMSTVSSGGFTNHDMSFMYYNTPLIEITCIIFMILAAIPFTVMIRFFVRRRSVRNSQVFLMFGIIAFVTLALAIVYHVFDISRVRHLLFAVVSTMTTTGFISYDLSKYSDFFCASLILLGLMGGCTGSTSGGLKIFRIQVLYSMVKHHFLKITYPHAVKSMRCNGQDLSQSAISGSVILLILYIVSMTFLLFLLTCNGFDIKNSLSIAAAILGNVGLVATEYGPFTVVIPQFSDWLKCVFSVFMVLGRLEFIAVLIIILQAFKHA